MFAALLPLISNVVGGIIDRIPNPEEKAKAEREAMAAITKGLLDADKGQMEVNKVEAGHRSVFVAGWRPAIGWACAGVLRHTWPVTQKDLPARAARLVNVTIEKMLHDGHDKEAASLKTLIDEARLRDVVFEISWNGDADIDLLVVKSIIVNQGMRLKRMKPRARGRADRIIKPTCHIEIILSDQEK